MHWKSLVGVLLAWFAFCGCQTAATTTTFTLEPEDPAEVAVGERLFLETRFAEFFFRNAGDDTNAQLVSGDPVMEVTRKLAGDLPGPFAGKSMNCAACHLVDQQLDAVSGGMRTYADFAERSPIPAREDGKNFAPRNSPPLVNSTLFRDSDFFLHFDGEFGSIEDLVIATLTGRNFGWLPQEQATAIAHIARVLRQDDGRDVLAQEFEAIPYRDLLKGEAESIPENLRLPAQFRIDVENANDAEIMTAVSKLIGAYVNNLVFLQDKNGSFNASPYDRFLIKNQLPRKPEGGETPLEYSRRLMGVVQALSAPQFVGPEDGSLKFHEQEFRFGALELQGMKIFFKEPPQIPLSPEQRTAGQIGNCIACHMAPAFTDFGFHNTGVSQDEYDSVHGLGKFQELFIPDYLERFKNPTPYLPATAAHPERAGKFVAIPSIEDPTLTDLGMWVVLGNDDMPKVQENLLKTLCRLEEINPSECTPDAMLPLAIARFKTPGLRDAGHSSPYMHNGKFPELEDVIGHYRDFADSAKLGTMRNPPSEFQGIALNSEDFAALVAFLNSLNEDYE